MEMKWYIPIILTPLFTGCVGENTPFRIADVTKKDDKICVSVKGDPTIEQGQAKLLRLTLSTRDTNRQMQQIWQADHFDNPTYIVNPGQCLPVNYYFEQDKEYNITIITAYSAANVDSKRIWLKNFTLNNLTSK